jgi:hypothetical protein
VSVPRSVPTDVNDFWSDHDLVVPAYHRGNCTIICEDLASSIVPRGLTATLMWSGSVVSF